MAASAPVSSPRAARDLLFAVAATPPQPLAGEAAGKDIADHLSGSFVSACDPSSALGRLFSAVAQGQVKPKTASTLAYLGSGSRFRCRGFGIGRLVIGRLFVGGADAFAPGVGVV